jgi:acetolactate synthase small subunit
MQIFHIRYRNTQGTLMRILNAVSRRGLDMTSVHADAAEQDHYVTLALDVTPKQIGQLHREWYAIPDVTDVRSSAGLQERNDQAHTAPGPHPPASATAGEPSRSALA